MAFTESDLLLSDQVLVQVSEALVNSGIADPITRAIAEQVQKVADYTLRYTIPEARQKRLVRPLVIHQLHSLLGQVSSAMQTEYDAAMKELEGIRDGKFGDLSLNESAVGLASAPAAWGSETKII